MALILPSRRMDAVESPTLTILFVNFSRWRLSCLVMGPILPSRRSDAVVWIRILALCLGAWMAI